MCDHTTQANALNNVARGVKCLNDIRAFDSRAQDSVYECLSPVRNVEVRRFTLTDSQFCKKQGRVGRRIWARLQHLALMCVPDPPDRHACALLTLRRKFNAGSSPKGNKDRYDPQLQAHSVTPEITNSGWTVSNQPELAKP
jgi:hypothetical protein